MNSGLKTIAVCQELPKLLHYSLAGVVHSTFASALNLLVAGRLVTLLPPDKGLLPYGAVLEQWPFEAELAPAAGTAVELCPLSIAICHHAAPKIILNGAKEIDLSINRRLGFIMPPDYLGRMHILAEALYSAASSAEGLAPVLPALFGERFLYKLPQNAWSAFFLEKAVAIKQALQAPEPATLSHFGKELAGFGPGLTPASDDFLAGMLAGFSAGMLADASRFERMAKNCRIIVEEAAAHTAFISGCFLRSAAEGLFGEYVLQMLSAFFSAEAKQMLLEKAALVCNIGSTSGSDTLAGIWFALAVA